jgi:hypothetical protein
MNMDIEKSWKDLTCWLSQEKKFSLPRGSDFSAKYVNKIDSIQIVPSETGIPRIISKNEWIKFCEKFQAIQKTKYDPLRPGHYAQISHNSSYLVAMVKANQSIS